MLTIILLTFVTAFLILFSGSYIRSKHYKFIGIIPSLLFTYFLIHSFTAHWDNEILLSYEWIPSLGISLDFKLDGLSLLFSLLITGIGSLVYFYASYYLKNHPYLSRFYCYLTLFMGSMLGLVLSDNMISIFMFWELTSITSFFLIGFNNEDEASRKSAFSALAITGLGGFFLLAGFILIGNIVGTYSITELLTSSEVLQNNALFPLILFFIFGGAFTKSAQFPFHFWLPGAMQAPTPVSAYLHSATMVNAGVFLLMRIYPIMGGTMPWKYALMITGGITMFLGAFFSMGQRDFKRILAFTTISALGTMILLIGIDTTSSLKAALVFFIVHGLYKGGLFMIAGIVDKTTGTRDIYDLHGLGRQLPLTAAVTLLALVSMAGLPPMLGFLGKELIYEAKMQLPDVAWLVLPLSVGANIMMVAISITVYYELFFRQKNKAAITLKYRERELPFYFLAGPVLLAAAGLLLGIGPAFLEVPVGNGLFFMGALTGSIHLSLWHGFNEVLLLSIFTVLSGIGVFMLRAPITRFIQKMVKWFDLWHLPTLFTQLINKYLATAAKNTNLLQHGYHRFYLLTFFLAVIALMGLQIFRITEIDLPELAASPLKIHVALLLLVTAGAVIYAVFSTSRLSAILAMGVVGYGIALLYLYYGAIDLAITQFLAETVLMVLFVMVIYYLPAFAVLSSRKSRLRDGLISLGVGTFITLVVLKAKFLNLETPISEYFAARAYTEGHGRNIVNVILVDFRALDTMGEVTVLILAAAGVYSLFRFQIKTLKKKKQNKA